MIAMSLRLGKMPVKADDSNGLKARKLQVEANDRDGLKAKEIAGRGQ